MENRHNFLYSHGSGRWRSHDEFQESDMWSAVRTGHDFGSSSVSDSRAVGISSPGDPSFISKRLPTASRMIPKSGGGKNPATPDTKTIRQSAPVNIPDWSKIYGSDSSSKNFRSWLDANSDDDRNRDEALGRSSWESEDYDDDDDDGEGNMIPPHEWVARKLARRQISSFSVCEGAGRTLKGRDLSRVRNDVLTKTGFLESNSNF